MRKIVVGSLVSLLFLSCSVPVSNNSTNGTSSSSLITAHSSLNFSDLEKEYNSFSTKALSDAYVSRMFNKFLVTTPNPTQVIRQLEFARYLKDVKSDSGYFNSLKTIIANDNSVYTKISTTSGVSEKRSAESATFGAFVDTLNPLLLSPASLSTTNITQSGFTAIWGSVSGADSYDLSVDNGTPLNVTATTYEITGLSNGVNHSWKVRANSSTGNGSYSPNQTVYLISNSCKSLKNAGANTSAIYTIDPDGSGGSAPFQAYCDMTTAGGGWTLVSHIYDKDNRDDILNNSNGSGWGNSANTPVSDTSFNVANATTPSYTESKFEWIFPLYSNQTFSHIGNSGLVNDRFKWINPNPSIVTHQWNLTNDLGVPNDPAYGRIAGVFGNYSYPPNLSFLNYGLQCGGGLATDKAIHYWGYGSIIDYGNNSTGELHNIPSGGGNRANSDAFLYCGTRESILNIWVR